MAAVVVDRWWVWLNCHDCFMVSYSFGLMMYLCGRMKLQKTNCRLCGLLNYDAPHSVRVQSLKESQSTQLMKCLVIVRDKICNLMQSYEQNKIDCHIRMYKAFRSTAPSVPVVSCLRQSISHSLKQHAIEKWTVRAVSCLSESILYTQVFHIRQ